MAFTNRERTRDRMGQKKFDQIFDYDGDGRVNSPTDWKRVDDANEDAEFEVSSLLIGKGFTADQVKLLESDRTLQRCAATLAAHYGATLKPELVDPQGNSYYSTAVTEARKAITQFATAERRSRTEPTSGTNANILGPERSPVQPKFFVAPSRDNPKGPGGF